MSIKLKVGDKLTITKSTDPHPDLSVGTETIVDRVGLTDSEGGNYYGTTDGWSIMQREGELTITGMGVTLELLAGEPVAIDQFGASAKMSRKQLTEVARTQVSAFLRLSARVDALETEISNLTDKPDDTDVDTIINQSIFDNLDPERRWAAMDRSGAFGVFKTEPHIKYGRTWINGNDWLNLGSSENPDGWENSLIERQAKELAGSDLVKAMLERGDKAILCAVSDYNDHDCMIEQSINAVIGFNDGEFKSRGLFNWDFAVAVDNNGKALTQADVGM